jgi:undecaprenyl-diphosphatase
MIPSITSADFSIDQALYAMRSPLSTKVFSLITELGSGAVVVALVVIAFVIFWRTGRWQYGIGMAVSVLGSLAVAEVVKYVVARARPPLYLHAVVETGYSFPSNHATVAMALYGFFIYAAWRAARTPWRSPLIILLCAIILLVGFSRIYLGVHYPSDVVAGYAIGFIFAWVGARTTQRLLRNPKRY